MKQFHLLFCLRVIAFQMYVILFMLIFPIVTFERTFSKSIIVLQFCLFFKSTYTYKLEVAKKNRPQHYITQYICILEDNCKSEKLREIILETIGLYPHQYSYQAKYEEFLILIFYKELFRHMKQVAEARQLVCKLIYPSICYINFHLDSAIGGVQ